MPAAVALVLALVAWVVWLARPRRAEGLAAANTNAGLRPDRFQAQGRTHMFQLPEGPPRGTLLVLPGCARWGPGFWPADACPECVGLTEDVAHTKQALARGYAILVPHPVDKIFPGQYCWSQEGDPPSLVKILEEFVTARGLAAKPIYVMGASSGGSVAIKMPGYLNTYGTKGLRVSGIVALVATKRPPSEFLRERGYSYFPPIVWITLAGADEIAAARRNVGQYRAKGPAAMASSPTRLVTPTFFSDRHPDISPARSAELAAALREAGMVGADGRLLADPKANKAWTGKLLRALPWLRGNRAFALSPTKASAILQALLVANGRHEHVTDFLTAALMWFESGGKASFDDLARRWRVTRPALLTAARYDGDEPGPAAAYAA